MFGRKPHGDVKKSAGKVLDPKKDTVTRLKHLRVVLETYDVHEAKNFFEANYSHIYYIFYDVFISVEADLKQRANKAHREELDTVLFIFEKILKLLPDLIHKRWQYHSIGRLMKKLLHTGNSIKLRREGMRLFLVWYQILMENATEECHQTFACLVPKLGSDEGLDMDIFTFNSYSDTHRVSAVEITAMLPPQSGEKHPDDMTKWLLESLLLFMVSEVNTVEWSSREMHEYSFTFLFNKFKKFYLHNIFPDFKNTTIYEPCLDLPKPRKLEEVDSARRPHTLAMCQEAVVRWMATFTHLIKKHEPPPATNPVPLEKSPEEVGDTGQPEQEPDNRVPGSNASTLSTASSYTEKDSASSSVCSDDHTVTEYDIVKRVLYSTQENVNIVHEVFRQALLFPFNHAGAIRRVIQVYKDWLHDEHRPPFMLEPVTEDTTSITTTSTSLTSTNSTSTITTVNTPSLMSAPTSTTTLDTSSTMSTSSSGPRSMSPSLTTPVIPTLAQLQEDSSDAGSVNSSPSKGSFSVPEHMMRLRNDLYPSVAHQDSLWNNSSGPLNCRAGTQKVVQVFITNASNVFLLEPSEKDGLLEEQVDLCKRVLNIYRTLVMNHTLDQRSWEQLLLILLHITDGVLTEVPPSNRERSRGGRLAQPLFQTLIVTWIKANLNVFISNELWDKFLHVVSSLTQWVELVKEWAKTMETLTRVLARQVYNLDLNDLPLERLKEGKRRVREKTHPSSSSNSRLRTFSRGWSRHEPVTGLRRRKPGHFGGSSPYGRTVTEMPDGNNLTQNNNDLKTNTPSGEGIPQLPAISRLEKSDLVRQRSLSQEQSPVRPRHQSELQSGIIRSSSDTNLMEEKKAGNFGSDVHQATDTRSLNGEVGTTEEPHAARSMKDPSPEDDTHEMDSLSGSYVSSFGDYSNLQGTNEKLQESQSSMYFSAPEDLDVESPSGEEPSSQTITGMNGEADSSNAEDPVLEDKETARTADTTRDSVASVGDVFTCQEDESFEEGATKYLDDTDLSRDIDLGEADDEPDRAVPLNHGPTQIYMPEIIVTSPDKVRGNPLLDKKIGNAAMGKKKQKQQVKGRTNTSKNAKNKQKNTRKKEEDQIRAEGYEQLVDISQSDTDLSLEMPPDSVTLLPGPAEEESSTDCLTNEPSVNTSGPEDQEVASVTASLTSTITDSTSVASVDSNSQLPYHFLDRSADNNSLGGDFNSIGKGSLDNKSDTDVLLRLSESRSPSPTDSKNNNLHDSRPSSPVANGHGIHNGDADIEDEEGGHPEQDTETSGKDSPTPDRMSLHLDDMESLPHEQTGNSELQKEKPEDMKSVLAGGVVVGWTADVAVVLWQRMLGALGDVNDITDPDIHARVYECLCDLLDTMLKMRDNMAVSKDNQKSPPPPELLPPLAVCIPWLFEALNMPKEYKRGKLLAYRMLCMTTVRNHDMELPMSHLSRFYRILHQGLVHSDQDTTNTLVRYCGPRFFSVPLPGSTMMILDFVHAANTIASTTDLKEAPRAEAVSILGSLICFPNHFGEMPVLQPNAVDMTIMHCNDVKDHVISMLLKAGKKEPSGVARCIAISCVGIFLYEELTHNTQHPRLKEAINVLLAILRFNNKSVAQVAADMLMLLVDYVGALLNQHPDLPRRIIEVIATVISTLLPSTENSNSEDDKRLLVSIMFVLLEWCMRVPLEMLLESLPGSKSLIYKTFKVLNMVVTGTAGTLTPRGSVTLAEMIAQEDDMENLRENHSNPTSPRTPLDVVLDYATKARRSPTSQVEGNSSDRDILKLAARTVMCQLVNHLGHFPIGGGAARLNSEVQEHHDISQISLDELSEEIFSAPSVQFFVVNNTTLVSFVEIPALTGVPGGGVTAGLTTGKTVTRVIIRDTAGKFCWDSTVLYGPPRCRAGSYPAAPQTVLRIIEDIDLLGRGGSGDEEQKDEEEALEEDEVTESLGGPCDLPAYIPGKCTEDNLDRLLEYVGHTSPECLLRPGEPLNVPDGPPDELTTTTETSTCTVVLKQKEREIDYYDRHKNDSSMVARALEPMENRDPHSPFQLCRLFLNQLGLMQWSKRPNFDLLKKDGKLLREVKNLDNHKCRETHKIAVIYVATGQEDKQSILTNTAGSALYEEFVAGLGWEVDLETHSGFMGGLQRNKSTGDSAPYYATSTREVIFHVSTRMPSATPEDVHRKLRHLGNDEVQIIWSEHTRDYRRGIIPTEFGDVLLVIYPLENGLFRIQINRKPEVHYFGPLFDGAIVDKAVLPGLVRATSINAGHLIRSQRPYFQSFYEERAKYVENIVQHQKEPTTFEDFSAQVFAPLIPHGGDMIGAFPSPDSLQLHTGHFGPGDQEGGKVSADKMSPHPHSKAGKVDSAETSMNAFSRRLSFGKSKQKSKQSSSHLITPPDSPNQPIKTKK